MNSVNELCYIFGYKIYNKLIYEMIISKCPSCASYCGIYLNKKFHDMTLNHWL